MSLNDRQQRFVDEYLANGGNATQAAISAGYSAKTAEATASRLLRNVKVADSVARGQKKIKKDLGITAEWKRDQLKKIIEACSNTVEAQKGKGDDATMVKTMVDAKAAISAIAELNKMDGDLAAIKTENKNTNTHTFDDLSEQEIDERIAELTGKA
ncbi:terminase small subunit [Endozoicomonas gorgoniicola]|uniref:Terminase small subunit n=1 Tax=Endozoicomonas gorgoniicola TaxID=1234144 RepID=A0ABT3N4D8_9GAMM|nr:terminase small subunit [Endozoicomonas gorgoniicola]MCW7556497.1 terminase small subunit [Endozoicomonas gorgoniicola]